MEFAKKCDKCQRFASMSKAHPEELTIMTSPWPFVIWGIDLIGQLPKGRGGAQHAVVAVEYFTKWIEAEALASIMPTKINEFVYRNIVCQCGVVHTIISDNDKQFDYSKLKELHDNLQIKKTFSSVVRPQANGQVEAINKTIKHNLNTKLEDLKGRWVDELPEVLWAYKTITITPTKETLFSLLYDYKAMVPVEIGMTSLKRELYNQEENHILQRREFNFLDQKRGDSQLRVAAYQQLTARYFNSKVKPRRFQVVDPVPRKVLQNKNALDLNWEGSFKIVEVLAPKAYKLSYLSREHIPRS